MRLSPSIRSGLLHTLLPHAERQRVARAVEAGKAWSEALSLEEA